MFDEAESEATFTDAERFLHRFPSEVYQQRVVAYPHGALVDYALAFAEAARALAQSMKGQPEDDLLLMPTLFLYRHAFELRLKVMLARLDVTPSTYGGSGRERPRNRRHHALGDLLTEYLKRASSLFESGQELPKELCDVIAELHDLDSAGFSFRYAEASAVTSSAYIDFPAMTAYLDEMLAVLSAVEDYIEDKAGWNLDGGWIADDWVEVSD